MEGINFKTVFNVDNKVFFDALIIRKEVFVDEQNVDISVEIDDYDDKAYHVVGYLLNETVCCARVFNKGNRWFWGRIAVLKKFRNKKVGSKLVEFLKEYSKKELYASEVYIQAQTHALDFYKKFGFEEFGEEYMEDGIRHIDMKMCL
ncbi:acetyltransferase, GNAT family protein [Spiroplasma corruscae]|uniref:Acetyltransferase, GNAT family protein n=1 Tax=Spiroplasma corruscae TaxID=216934 RepID=A0A222EPA4_9MOLU|nr:GNAT family N-acetyltransferase [Spiroplasma corruscae]ASP28330.1 acetyltransferase, GNAT family protein [Spiroplasma corruscae]